METPDDDLLPPQELIESLAKDCRCCQECHPGDVPCAGLLAGGPCDQSRCTCDDEYEDNCDDYDPMATR
jgi:hypothetical protein